MSCIFSSWQESNLHPFVTKNSIIRNLMSNKSQNPKPQTYKDILLIKFLMMLKRVRIWLLLSSCRVVKNHIIVNDNKRKQNEWLFFVAFKLPLTPKSVNNVKVANWFSVETVWVVIPVRWCLYRTRKQNLDFKTIKFINSLKMTDRISRCRFMGLIVRLRKSMLCELVETYAVYL